MADTPEDTFQSYANFATNGDTLSRWPGLAAVKTDDLGGRFEKQDFRGDQAIQSYTRNVGQTFEDRLRRDGYGDTEVNAYRPRLEEAVKAHAQLHALTTMAQRYKDEGYVGPGSAPYAIRRTIPFTGMALDTERAMEMKDAADRFNAETANAGHYRTVARQLAEESHAKERGFAGQTFDIASQIPVMAAEWIGSGGTAAPAQGVAKAGVGALLTRLASQAGRTILQQAPMLAGKTIAGTVERTAPTPQMTPEGLKFEKGDDWATALAKSAGSEAVNTGVFGSLDAFGVSAGKNYITRVLKGVAKMGAAQEVSGDIQGLIDRAQPGGPLWTFGQAVKSGDKEKIQQATQGLLSNAAAVALFEGGMNIGRRKGGTTAHSEQDVQEGIRTLVNWQEAQGTPPFEGPQAPQGAVEKPVPAPQQEHPAVGPFTKAFPSADLTPSGELKATVGQGSSARDVYLGMGSQPDSVRLDFGYTAAERSGVGKAGLEAGSMELARGLKQFLGDLHGTGQKLEYVAIGGRESVYQRALEKAGYEQVSGPTGPGNELRTWQPKEAPKTAPPSPEVPAKAPEAAPAAEMRPNADLDAMLGPESAAPEPEKPPTGPLRANPELDAMFGMEPNPETGPPPLRQRYVDDAGVTHEIDPETGFQYHVASAPEEAPKPSLKERMLAKGRGAQVPTPEQPGQAPRPAVEAPAEAKSTFEEAGLLPHEEYAYGQYKQGGENYGSFRALAEDPELLKRYNEDRQRKGQNPKGSITGQTVKNLIDRAHQKLGGEGSLFANMSAEGRARMIEDGSLTLDRDLHNDPDVQRARGDRIDDLEARDRALDNLFQRWQNKEISDEDFTREHSSLVSGIEGQPEAAATAPQGAASVRPVGGVGLQPGAEAGPAPAEAAGGVGTPRPAGGAAAPPGGGEAYRNLLNLPPGERGAAVAPPRPEPVAPMDQALRQIVQDQIQMGQEGTLGFGGGLGIRFADNLYDHLKGTLERLHTDYRRLAGEMFPRTHDANRETGEALSRHAAAPIYAKMAAAQLIDKVLGPNATPEEARLLGTALQEMRHRYAKSNGSAPNAISFVGQTNSPLATEADYQQVIRSPRFQDFIANWKKYVVPVIEENFRKAQGIDPNDPIDSMTQLPGLPMNAIAIQDPTQATPGTVYIGGKGNLKNLKIRPSPFASQAELSHVAYDTDARSIIENSLMKGTDAATKAEFYRTGQEQGVVQWGKPGQQIEGWKEIPFSRPPKGTQAAADGQVAYVKESIYPEVRTALDVDRPMTIPVVSSLLTGTTKAALASTVEAAYHSKNLATFLMKPGVRIGDLLTNAYDVLRGKAMDQLTDLAKIGATKDEHTESGMLWGGKTDPTAWMGKALNFFDQTMRLTADDAFKRLEQKGLVEGTEANRRNFINQLGQYNRKAQSQVVRLLRDTGIGPFATAGTNYYVQGLRSLLMDPGVKATSPAAAAQLRAVMLGKTAAVLGAAALANYFISGRPDGDDKTPLGAVKIGNRAGGKTAYFDLTNLIGLTRGAREVGLLSLLEGKRAGATGGEILDKAKEKAVDAIAHPALGPGPQFVKTALTGKTFGGYQVSEKAERGESQGWNDLVAAIKQANPVYASLSGFGAPKGKEVATEERVMKLLGPYGLQYRKTPPGKPPTRMKEVPEKPASGGYRNPYRRP